MWKTMVIYKNLFPSEMKCTKILENLSNFISKWMWNNCQNHNVRILIKVGIQIACTKELFGSKTGTTQPLQVFQICFASLTRLVCHDNVSNLFYRIGQQLAALTILIFKPPNWISKYIFIVLRVSMNGVISDFQWGIQQNFTLNFNVSLGNFNFPIFC
jgi:hypothetical protein